MLPVGEVGSEVYRFLASSPKSKNKDSHRFAKGARYPFARPIVNRHKM